MPPLPERIGKLYNLNLHTCTEDTFFFAFKHYIKFNASDTGERFPTLKGGTCLKQFFPFKQASLTSEIDSHGACFARYALLALMLVLAAQRN